MAASIMQAPTLAERLRAINALQMAQRGALPSPALDRIEGEIDQTLAAARRPTAQPQAQPSVAVSEPMPQQVDVQPPYQLPQGQTAPMPRAAVADPAVAAADAGMAAEAEADTRSAYEKAAEAARLRMQAILAQTQGAGASDRDKFLALALGGARMAASRNPTLFGAAGEGAEAGIGAYQQADQRAKAEALRRAGQEMEGEAAAERAGARAEDRVIRREDIAARKQARLDALQARKEDLQARRDDARLSREERAEAARQLRETQVEIAKITAASRESVATTAADARVKAAETAAAARAARAAGAPPARIREAEALVEKGKAPDFGTAYDMVRAGVNDLATYQRNVQAAKVDLRKGLTDITGKLTIPEEELEERARDLVRSRVGSAPGPAATAPAAAPAPAPQAAPAAGSIPKPPQGVPQGARYSPSQGKWWWQENGQWQSR